ncbi:MAG: GTP 3',8-cyclase MoaA [Bacteroidota bacterium]
MPKPQLTDTFGRHHDYLRISLTDACNLRCVYCMPNEKVLVTPSAKLMQVGEIENLAKVFVGLGVKKIRLTGGEPLLRKDAKEIIQKLSKLPVELTISTNAVLVDQYIETFKAANIRSVNVSLDTLNPDEFFAITKRGDFKKIMSNIYLLLSQNFKVKVNMVVMKGINEHAILDFISWTKDFPLDVRFIEFMPFAGNEWLPEKVFSYKEMLNIISTKYTFLKLEDAINDTAKKYTVPGHAGTFAFITTITEPFCGTCNRLRLTADGKMKNCLFSQEETDLLMALRKGEDITPLILSCLESKKRERGGRFDFENAVDASTSIALNTASSENRSMIQIGG